MRQLEIRSFVDHIKEALSATGLDPTALVIEITESTLMRDADATVRRLRDIKELGVRVAIDDFGTGYSSLAYLRQFPVDALKIDRSFISAMADSPESGALIHTLVELGRTLGLETLAEGIEDNDQLAKLREEHCDRGQGFLFSKAHRARRHRGLPPRLGRDQSGGGVGVVADLELRCRHRRKRHRIRRRRGRDAAAASGGGVGDRAEPLRDDVLSPPSGAPHSSPR